MRVSSGALLGLLSVAYVVLKLFAFLAQNDIKIKAECDDQPVMDMLRSIKSFTMWDCLIASIVTLGIMIYYISRTNTHRNEAWCRDEGGNVVVTHEERARSACLYEVRAVPAFRGCLPPSPKREIRNVLSCAGVPAAPRGRGRHRRAHPRRRGRRGPHRAARL